MKKVKIIFILSLLLVIILLGSYSYSKYNTEVSGEVTSKVAKWNISLQSCSSSSCDDEKSLSTGYDSETGEISTVEYEVSKAIVYEKNPNGENDIRDGKFGPGGTGYFDLMIKTNDTEVSFDYTISLEKIDNPLKTSADIRVYTLDGTDKNYLYPFDMTTDDSGNEIIDESKNNITGTINYSDFKDDEDYSETIRIYVEWIDCSTDECNVNDTELGMSDSLQIPLVLSFEQSSA